MEPLFLFIFELPKGQADHSIKKIEPPYPPCTYIQIYGMEPLYSLPYLFFLLRLAYWFLYDNKKINGGDEL